MDVLKINDDDEDGVKLYTYIAWLKGMNLLIR